MSREAKRNLRTSITRLTALRDTLKTAKKTVDGYILTLPNGRHLFDIGTWGEPIDADYVSEAQAKRLSKKLNVPLDVRRNAPTACGTAACVLGTAGMIPAFRKAGLRTHLLYGRVSHNGKSEIDAFAGFFNTDRRQAEDVCLPSSYEDCRLGTVTPHDAVKKIDTLIKSQVAQLEQLS